MFSRKYHILINTYAGVFCILGGAMFIISPSKWCKDDQISQWLALHSYILILFAISMYTWNTVHSRIVQIFCFISGYLVVLFSLSYGLVIVSNLDQDEDCSNYKFFKVIMITTVVLFGCNMITVTFILAVSRNRSQVGEPEVIQFTSMDTTIEGLSTELDPPPSYSELEIPEPPAPAYQRDIV